MTEHPASVIRRAAALLKDRAEAATPGPWWSDDSDDCWQLHGVRDIIPPLAFPDGSLAIGKQVVNRQILKAAKHGTPYAEYWPDNADAAWIALMHPGLGLAVAAWLDEAAGYVEAYVAREYHDRTVHDEPCDCDRPPLLACNRCGHVFPDGCDCWNGSLSVARLILGEPGAAAVPGETPYARGKTQQENQGRPA